MTASSGSTYFAILTNLPRTAPGAAWARGSSPAADGGPALGDEEGAADERIVAVSLVRS